MINFSNGLNGMQPMTQLATAYQTMAIAAGEVFFRRSMMIAIGSMSVPDEVNMVAEKATTLAEEAGQTKTALVKGENLVGVATAALKPYGTRTAASTSTTP